MSAGRESAGRESAGRESAGRESVEDALISAVATPARAVAVIGELVGSTLSFGPVPAGPGGMATAVARGPVGDPGARALSARHVEVTVPVDLDLVVELGRREIPVDVELTVRIGLRGRLLPGGDTVVVDVDDLRPEDIDVDVHARGVGGVLVRRLGDLDAEIRQHVITWVDELLSSPEADRARHLAVEESDTA